MFLTTILLVAALAGSSESTESTERSVAEMGECSPRTGPQPIWTRELRRETRKRVRAACRHAGAAPIVCAYADAIVVRESSGRAGVRHTKGENEDGLGAMGLSLRWHRNRWPGDADPDFCRPEVSFAVAHSIMWSAVRKFGARTAVEMQAIYAGSWSCYITRDDERVCRPMVRRNHVKSTCSRMKARGFSCHAKITAKDLGDRVRKRDRQSWAESVAYGS